MPPPRGRLYQHRLHGRPRSHSLRLANATAPISITMPVASRVKLAGSGTGIMLVVPVILPSLYRKLLTMLMSGQTVSICPVFDISTIIVETLSQEPAVVGL